MQCSTLLFALSCTFLGSHAAPVVSNGDKGQGFAIDASVSDSAAIAKVADVGATNPAKPNPDAIMQAVGAWSQDVVTVSNILNGLPGKSASEAVAMAKAATKAEADEGGHKALLAAAAGAAGAEANNKLTQFAPKVVDGLNSIIQNSSPQNIQAQLAAIQSVRNANVLPSITALMQAAMNAAGIKQAAPRFPPTNAA